MAQISVSPDPAHVDQAARVTVSNAGCLPTLVLVRQVGGTWQQENTLTSDPDSFRWVPPDAGDYVVEVWCNGQVVDSQQVQAV